MWTIKNKLFQPLTLQRADGTSLHLLDRASATIQDHEVSPDIRRAARKGQITMTPVEDQHPNTQPVPPVQPMGAPGNRRKRGDRT